MSALVTKDSLTYYLTDGTVLDRPIAWEISLHTDAPGYEGLDNEVDDVDYVRQAITFVLDETDPERPFVENTALIEFPEAVVDYTVTHIVVWDSLGNIQTIQSLREPKIILATEQAQIAAGEIKVGVVS